MDKRVVSILSFQYSDFNSQFTTNGRLIKEGNIKHLTFEFYLLIG